MSMSGMESLQAQSILDNIDLSGTTAIDPSEPPRKLAVLGLPWETTEDTLRVYFSQFGPLEHAEIMKDRYTGKSRGFGFVMFTETVAAQRALAAEHTIDGRRCEAKIALPKGEPSPPRTTRIFVARIPPSVTETQFRSYFEAFGKLQDAYMPRDHSKQGFRGIGFVTFASPDSVEKVMAVKHWMNGHEIAIDRATPKEEPSALKSMFARLPLSAGQRRSFDNGAGIIGPGLTSVMNVNGNGLSNLGPGNAAAAAAAAAGIDSAFTQLRSLSEDRELNGIVSRGLEVANLDMQQAAAHAQNGVGGYHGDNGGNKMSSQALRAGQALGLNLGLGLQNSNAAAAAAAAAATTAALQSLAKAQHGGLNDLGLGMNHSASLPPLAPNTALHNLTGDLSASFLSNALSKATINGQNMGGLSEMGTAAAVQQLMAAAAVQSSRRSLDSAAAALKRLENPAIASARAGPRIFIGKLTKETSEADVKEYFMRFGYVMDVYLPKSKDNKMEHRGFGFVTFETEAAIQRVVSHGSHRLRGSTIAIDIAMPKVEEEALGLESGLDSGSAFLNSGALGLMAQRI
uniref:RRM domain-containing protein n=1 Tax=Chlamydomonas leiostraca TaxID=1034604 RepID=A0A7S0RZM2_9CHLO|mmetsp:Transcript_36511/g.92193  ORF Transcript_36511/g.92193 Transcript_36511/m.92193 type:complete len:571 (+) Transcript_36511:262-1974(+)